MMNHTNTKLEQQIESPLEYISTQDKRHYYKRALLRAILCILAGPVFSMIITFLDLHGFTPSNNRRDGLGLLLVGGALLLPLYGILSLFTLHKRAEDLARKSLVAKNSKLVPLERERIVKLDDARSKFLKNFTFLLVGILFLATFLFLLYLYITGKLN